MNEKNIRAAYEAACEGMVLLENRDRVLPLKGKKIALLGTGTFDYQKGGGGSANVFCGEFPSLCDELSKKNIEILAESKTALQEYTKELVCDWGRKADIAVCMFKRLTGEGADRPISDFELKEEERLLLEYIEGSDFESAVIILNIGSAIDVESIKQYKKAKGVLLAWQAGMTGPRAIADIICGDVNPSGKLCDTFAKKYEDNPSSDFFNSDVYIEYYGEDIFVGYRYFETFAKDKVSYPFGYGLSYTDFEISLKDISGDNERITLDILVRNIGEVAGKESIQVYTSSPEGEVPKAALELRAFGKTKLLAPGEEEILRISFAPCSMAYFDEKNSCFALDAGEYPIYFGRSIRDLNFAGNFFAEMKTVVEKVTLKYTNSSPARIGADGKLEAAPVYDARSTVFVGEVPEEADAEGISLIDVDEGRMSLDEFVAKLSPRQLIDLAHGKPPSVIRGTGGIGNMPKLGIPNPQTADGPAGVRRTVPTVCVPCATALACTWNEEAIYSIGEAIARECEENNVDILLAPGLNIHRNPLCGRNFEYYSEDPIVAGTCAAAFVEGVQSRGIGATVKHFAANNREANRKRNDSRVSERALREIYLRGFELVIKRAKPWCVMTSYNSLNGKFTSESRNLIEGILRGEWGFEGLVMSDWETTPTFTNELLAGNNLRMPFAFDRDFELTLRDYSWRAINRSLLCENAKRILKVIMKTKCFKRRDFGIIHEIKAEETVIPAHEVRIIGMAFVGLEKDKDGEFYIYNLSGDFFGRRVYADYRLSSDCEREAALSLVASFAHEDIRAEILIDGELQGVIDCRSDDYSLGNKLQTEAVKIKLPEGESELRVLFRAGDVRDCARLWSINII